MSETVNYGLYIENDDSARFKQWREKMNGENDSNMVKIDDILSRKADSSAAAYATLAASAWAGTDAPFTQEISIEGLKNEHNGLISIAHEATQEQRRAAREAMLSIIGQGDGRLIIAADGEMPETDIPVYIILLG